MNRLLLDSNTVIWWDDGSDELGVAARKMIQDAESVYVSAASEWELSIKAALSRISLRRSILDATVAAGFQPLPISFEHAQAVRQLKPIHKDPFDRLLVAVAMVEGLAIVSSDPVLSKYPISVIDARS
jgi:PIN domain nuclease of toxin-antitoxin system